MKRFMFTVAALALTVGFTASAQTPSSDGSGLGSMGSRTKLAKPPKGEAKPDPKGKSKISPAEREKKQNVLLTKKALLLIVNLCDKPGACDESSRSRDDDLISLLEEKQNAFLKACKVCASAKECEEERLRIRDGNGSPGLKPCK